MQINYQLRDDMPGGVAYQINLNHHHHHTESNR